MLRTKIYFASDFHLGVPDHQKSLAREKRVVSWLNAISVDAKAVYLVGDVFDFWFEYDKVVPKGFTRLIGKLCEMQDAGIDIHLFHGNHDLWQFGYFENEIGCKVHPKGIVIDLGGKRCMVAHGDGLGPGQKWFKMLLSIYRTRLYQRLYAMLHPSLGIGFAEWFSDRSKQKNARSGEAFLGEDNEYLIQFVREQQDAQPFDYYIFGHRHLAFDLQIKGARVINLGDWFSADTYAVFDGYELSLKSWKP